jgi:hypothetical protein
MRLVAPDPTDPFFGDHPESRPLPGEEEMGEVAKIETNGAAVAITPMQMLQTAVEQGADLDKLSKLMDLQERWEANEARKAFVAAKAAFQKDAPTIAKTRSGHNTKYAGLAETLEQVRALMAEHELSHSWQTAQDGNQIAVTCVLTHAGGHQETTSLSAAPDASGSKNPIQAVGSTVSYLQRYTLSAVLGLASREQDDDGNGAGAGEPISAEQREELLTLMDQAQANTKRFLAHLAIPSVDALPASRFEETKAMLEKKKATAGAQ